MGVRVLAWAITAVFTACFTVTAQTRANQVAVISVQGVIAGTKEGQKASKELEAKAQPKQKEFDQRQAELARLEDQFNKGGNVLSEDKRDELLRDIEQRKKKLDRDMSDAKDELTAEQERLLQGLGQRITALVTKYAKEHGYSLVLDFSSPSAPILYAAPAVDITQEIIAQCDKTNAAAAAAGSPHPPSD
jgi:outer membrane protein